MYCPNCGKEIADESKFCPYCGTRIETDKQVNITPDTSTKTRHGFVTFWLWFSGVVAVIYGTLLLIEFADIGEPADMINALLAIVSAIGFYLLLKWKKEGFWIVFVTSILEALIAIVMDASELNFFVSIIACAIDIGVLYGILQLKQDGVSCWSQLKE